MDFDPEHPEGNRWKRLGDMLLEMGIITEAQLAEALAEKQRQKCFLGQALVKLGYISQNELISFLVKQCKIPHINLLDYNIEPRIVAILPSALCLRYKLMPIDQMGSILTICMVNPLDIDALEHARDICPTLKLKPILCTPEHFEIRARQFLIDADEEKQREAAKPDVSLSSFGLKKLVPPPSKAQMPLPEVAPPQLDGAPGAALAGEDFSFLVRDVLGELLNTFQGPLQGQPGSSDHLWSSTNNQSAQFSFTVDVSGKLCYVSPSVEATTGYSPAEFRACFLDFLTDHPANATLRQVLTLSLSGQQRTPIEAEFRVKDGAIRTLVVALIPVFDSQEELIAVQGVARDVTRRAQVENSLYMAATHDALTGLLNLRSFFSRLEEITLLAKRHGTPVSIAIMNVDDFTRINEVHGNQEGDAVLRQVGKTLRQTLRGEDIVARSGGDEFCILMPNVAPKQGQHGIDRYKSALSQAPFATASGQAINLTVTIGLATASDNDRAPEKLLNAARVLVHQGKLAGGNQVVLDVS